MTRKVPIAVAEGDGIGPEIMAATLHLLEAAGSGLDFKPVDIGEKVYLKGFKAGIEPQTWDILRQTKSFLKAPITTPQGGGFKSLNVTIRTTMGLYANVRPCVSYYPFVKTRHPGMDVVIVRENEEDLYTGIEYQQTPDTVQALKIITRTGSEKIIRYAFEYAKSHHRKKVTCFTKDNILKLTDGLFHKVFEEIAKEYPEIISEHWIVDIGAAKLADTPEAFDVIVMPNLYGDILSDVAAQIAGSVGLAGSANIGQHGAMFEAIHGSAPRRAGQNLANPSGLMLAAVLMLAHIGKGEAATLIHNAWMKTLEEGIHTYDIYKEGTSHQRVGTKEFGEAVAKNIGKTPETLQSAHYGGELHSLHKEEKQKNPTHKSKKETRGVDVFVESSLSPEELQKKLNLLSNHDLELSMISNRGVKVWPGGHPETFCSDSWRCRFVSPHKGKAVTHRQIVDLLQRMTEANVDFGHTEHLCTFNGEAGYTLSQEEQ